MREPVVQSTLVMRRKTQVVPTHSRAHSKKKETMVSHLRAPQQLHELLHLVVGAYRLLSDYLSPAREPCSILTVIDENLNH